MSQATTDEDTFRCEACAKDFPESEIGDVHDPVNGGMFCETCSEEWIAAMNACSHQWDGDGTLERTCEKCGKYETPEDACSASIVKVQIPFAGDRKALIYDESREHVVERELTMHEAALMRGDFTAYFKAYWSSIVGWGLNERVEGQRW